MNSHPWNPKSNVYGTLQMYMIMTAFYLGFTAIFNNTGTLKLKAQPTKVFFAGVNQVFGGSSQLTTTAELCSLSELCTTI